MKLLYKCYESVNTFQEHSQMVYFLPPHIKLR